MKKTAIAGLDLGNGFVKIFAQSSNGRIIKKVFPAGLEVHQENLESYNINNSKEEVIICQMPNDIKYKIVNVDCSSDFYISTNYGVDRYNVPEYQKLSEFTLAYIAHELDVDELFITIGVPSMEKGSINEKDIERLYSGVKLVVINEVERVFESHVIKVVAQPIGTVLNLALGGREDLQDKYVAIVDGGTGTVDLDAVKSMNLVQADRATYQNMGTYYLFDKVATEINRLSPSIEATWKGVEKSWNRGIYFKSAILQFDFNDIKRRISKEHVQMIKTQIFSKWKNQKKFDAILISGGMAEIEELKMELEKIAENTEIVPNPQMSNALGYFKYTKLVNGHEKTS